MTITDAAPAVSVTKTADPTSLAEPGGPVTFTARVSNLGVSTDPLTLQSLVDDIHGNLNGQGGCSVPQTIAPGSFYECSFTATVSGVAGDSETDTVTATVQDDEGTPASASDTATVTLVGTDFGDAPDPSYATLLASDGARHLLGSGLALGLLVDSDPDGQPDPSALGDDLDGTDDEDGLTFSVLRAGSSGTVDVVASGAGLLSAWIDFDRDGDWGGPGEQIFTDLPLAAGANIGLSIAVPVGATLGTTFARFRFSTDSGLQPTGEASDGEVEDVVVEILEAAQTSIAVTKTASPTSVEEPGGSVTFTVRVDNTGNMGVDLAGLVDDIHGDLNGQGTCAVPRTVATGGFYECSFTATVNGNAGESETDTVTATASDDEGNTAQASDTATVTITDVLPSIGMTKTASPTSVVEPGGSVTFTARVDNTSADETVTLGGLVDDIHGNLDGQGTCSLPRSIPAGGFYQCSFTAVVSGNAGVVEVDTITALASDGEGNSVQASDSASVTITDSLPSIQLTKTASPTIVLEPGGNVAFSLRVDNTSPWEPVTLTSLVDDVHGDLDGQGTCSLPRSILAGSGYDCSFTAFVAGNAGYVEVDTVTGIASDDEGNTARASDTASVTIIALAEPEIEVAPVAVAFPRRNIHLGPSKVRRTVTITNVSENPLALSEVSIGGSHASSFAIFSDTGQTSLATSEVREVVVAFDPPSVGIKSAHLTIRSNDSDEPAVEVSLLGEGFQTTGPELDFWPEAMYFGPKEPGTGPTPSQRVQFSSEGTERLEFVIEIVGADADQFGFGGIVASGDEAPHAKAGTIGIGTNPGGFISIGIFFRPTSAGQKTALLSITSNDADESDVAVILVGNAGDLDFGDAPDIDPSVAPSSYPTLLANDGARHALGAGLFLGAGVDAETDGRPDGGAAGDDSAGIDDEDGVTFSALGRGGSASVDVVASGAGLLNAWIDWNQDGDWQDAGERIL
ncbi:MAG: choice-of-anchor D domain-containing protein, partial [Holophagales bacterium]|nr:choice-of-anchor D domain-containing protein [Holophagales bacterium]